MGPLDHIEPIYPTIQTIRADIDRYIHEHMGEAASADLHASMSGLVQYAADGQRIPPWHSYCYADDTIRFRWPLSPEPEPEQDQEFEIDDTAFDALFS